MKWKVDENGHILIGPKGNALRIAEDGTEYEFDVISTRQKLGDAMNESKTRKIKLRDLQASYDLIPESIRKDPQSAVDAIVTIGGMDSKHKADLDKIKADLKVSYDSDLKVQADKFVALETRLHGEKLTTRFATTKSLDDTVFAGTREVAESYFKKSFVFDEAGAMTGKHADGSTIYSKERPGEPANFDECLTSIIKAHPNKDSFMLPTGQRGQNNQNKGQNSDQTPTGSVNKIAAGLAARKAGN